LPVSLTQWPVPLLSGSTGAHHGVLERGPAALREATRGLAETTRRSAAVIAARGRALPVT